jgi:uncharacterized protein YndB with AHSA1/START domain
MSLDVRIERVLDATPEEAFEAWVSDDARMQWYQDGPEWVVTVASDLRVGGEWSVSFGPSADQQYHERGVYLEIDRPHRLVYTTTFSGPGHPAFDTTVTVTFEERDGKTHFTLVDAGFPDEATRDGHAGGWPNFIDRFQRAVEAASART